MEKAKQITIGGLTFTVVKDTFAKFDELKKQFGLDLMKGATADEFNKFIESNRSPELLDALVEPNVKSKDMDTPEKRQKFFYENAGLSELNEAIRFFRGISK